LAKHKKQKNNTVCLACAFCVLVLCFLCSAPVPSIAATSSIADAAMKRDGETLRSLLQTKVDVNLSQADGTTALHWAVRWNDTETIRALIKAGANPSKANRAGATPLFLAAVNGSASTIELLLNSGANSNQPVLSHGETALMMAARAGKPDAVKVLLDHGAFVNATEDLRGTTALMWAAEQNQADVVRLLAERGAEVNARSKAVALIKRGGLGFARPGPDGAIPFADPIGGLSALLFAVREGALASVRVLLEKGADINQTSVDGSAPMLVAVQNGHYEIARLLLDRGADPNLANAKGWTPLYLAVKNRNQETTAIPGPNNDGVLPFIKVLLDRGANPNLRITEETEVHQGMTALWLKEPGATPLLRAALCGDLTVVQLLMAHGADPFLPTFDQTSPLMVAAGVGWADGMTHEYSESETLELVKLLVDSGAIVNQANDHGITALHGAAYKGADKVVRFLVDRGADLAAKDKGEDYGFGASTVPMTPLNWAEGVPIGMSSAIYHPTTVTLLTRLMQERGIPVVSNTFHGQKR
jgi:ankyrin repeat protein